MEEKENLNIITSENSNQNWYKYTGQEDLLPYLLDLIIKFQKLDRKVIIHNSNGLQNSINEYCLYNIDCLKGNFRIKLELKKLLNDLTLLYSNTIGDYKLIDLIYMISAIKEDIVPYPFSGQIKFTFLQEELYDLKIVIQKFSAFRRFYKQDGLKANELAKYNQKVFTTNGIDTLKQQAKTWSTELDEIISLLLTGIQSLESNKKLRLLDEFNKNVDELEAKIDLIDNFQSKFKLSIIEKPSYLSLDKKSKAAYKEWQILLKQLALEKNLTNIEEAVSIINSAIETLRKTYEQSKKAIDNDLKSVTELNTSEESIMEGCNRMRDIVLQINSFGLYTNKQECNSYNINKIILFIRTLRNDLNILLQHDHLKSAIDWYNCKENLNHDMLNFLNQLEAIPEGEWKMQFEYYYLNTYLNHLNIELYGNNNQVIDAFAAKSQMLIELSQQYLHLSNNPNGKVIWEDIINLDSFNFENHTLISIDNFLNNSSVINFNSIEDSIENRIPFHLNTESTLNEIHPSKLLQHVKKIAFNLFPYLNKAIGFQLKSANVISTIHPHWQNDISVYIEQKGGKAFDISDLNSLIDFLLSVERPLFIIIQDGVLSNHLSFDLSHFTLINDIRKFGIKLVNISTFDILKDKTAALNELYNKIPIASSSKTTDQHVCTD